MSEEYHSVLLLVKAKPFGSRPIAVSLDKRSRCEDKIPSLAFQKNARAFFEQLYSDRRGQRRLYEAVSNGGFAPVPPDRVLGFLFFIIETGGASTLSLACICLDFGVQFRSSSCPIISITSM